MFGGGEVAELAVERSSLNRLTHPQVPISSGPRPRQPLGRLAPLALQQRTSGASFSAAVNVRRFGRAAGSISSISPVWARPLRSAVVKVIRRYPFLPWAGVINRYTRCLNSP